MSSTLLPPHANIFVIGPAVINTPIKCDTHPSWSNDHARYHQSENIARLPVHTPWSRCFGPKSPRTPSPSCSCPPRSATVSSSTRWTCCAGSLPPRRATRARWDSLRNFIARAELLMQRPGGARCVVEKISSTRASIQRPSTSLRRRSRARALR